MHITDEYVSRVLYQCVTIFQMTEKCCNHLPPVRVVASPSPLHILSLFGDTNIPDVK